VVNAKLPGPAWWKVSDADTTIYILGTLAALPKGAAWDTSVLDHRLDGAFALIMPPVGRAGVTDIPALLSLRGKLKSDQPLDQAAPELAPRLAKVRAQLGKAPDAYNGWSPLGAGMMIGIDYQKVSPSSTAASPSARSAPGPQAQGQGAAGRGLQGHADGQGGGEGTLGRGGPALPGGRAQRGRGRDRRDPGRRQGLGPGRRARRDRRSTQLPALHAQPAGHDRHGAARHGRRSTP
jgi:hypothetical protein